MKPITVLLADDNPLLRAVIKRVLERESDLEIVGEAQDGEQAVALAAELCPDVVLMDVAMPRLSGLNATRQLLSAFLPHPPKVLMLSAYNHALFIAAAKDAGAQGYLIKDRDTNIVAAAIRVVHQGGQCFETALLNPLHETKPQSVHH